MLVKHKSDQKVINLGGLFEISEHFAHEAFVTVPLAVHDIMKELIIRFT